jgi:predicted ATPase/class 3 adenylate cyclase
MIQAAVRRDLPTGTVTFLFTDVEGSTRLLHELGAEAYAEALAEHRRVIRAACTAEEGVEVDTQGDAFFFAFPTAPGALAAAAAFTDALASGPIQVRVGLHTGTPLLGEEGYVGDDVHRAARIAAAGHGGQVLVSESAAPLVGRELRDLGAHRLKDLSAPQRIYQVGYADHPRLASLELTNLPIPTTPFLGRERELAEVAALLARDDVRLLTLTGAGGTGKSRLAAQAAGRAADAFAAGVWWVPLAPLHDPGLVLPTAAQVVGAQDGLAAAIADKRMLVLFDNFEQVVDAASELSELLARCANLKLVVTSREPLHLAAEQEYPVPPLAPAEGAELFVARARAAKPDFQPDPAVGAICARLDELPLAIELAAARVKALSPELILERLDKRLPLLTGGARDVPERQRTLRATIEWSYDLLTPAEQELFRRLSVFAGGWSFVAAEEVVSADLDTMQSLVDKSLVRFTGDRYWMFETIREYASELLDAAGEREPVREAHLAFFLSFVVDAEPKLTQAGQDAWFERLAAEQDNIRAALAHACDSGDGERALMLSGSFWRFWWTRAQLDEAASWYERSFALGGEGSETARARGLFGLAHVSEARGDIDRTRREFEEAVALFRRIGDERWLVLALAHLAGAYSETRAEAVLLEALEIAEASADRRGSAIVKGNLGNLFLERGDDVRAAQLYEEALASHRELGDVYGVAVSLASVALLALRQGDLDSAVATARESVVLSSSIGDALTLSFTLSVTAAVALARDDPRVAARLCGAVEALLGTHGVELGPVEDSLRLETARAARSRLGADFEQEWAAGTALDLTSAVDLALDALADA